MAESSQPQTQVPRIFTPINISELDLEDRDCPICQEPLGQRSEQPIRLPCTHTFGKRCITLWLLEHDSCPQCRRLALPQPQPQPQIESQPPPPQAGQNHPIPAYLAMLPDEQQSFMRDCWRGMRARILHNLSANRITPITKAMAFVEDQTSADSIPGIWTTQYCAAIGRKPQMLINGDCTAKLARDEILVPMIEQELNGMEMGVEAEEQSRDFAHLAEVLRELYIEDYET